MESYLVIDTENSGAQRNKAHPFDGRNSLLLLGTYSSASGCNIFDIDYSGSPNGGYIVRVREQILTHRRLVGFNIKYDLLWLLRYGIITTEDLWGSGIKIWDCQLAEFILSGQSESYPSLDRAAEGRGVPLKSGTLKEYIDKGLDVSDVPLPELTEYLKGDLISTNELYLKQLDLIEEGGYWELMHLQMQDLLVLVEMEWNGLKYDIEKSVRIGAELADQEAEIITSLSRLVDSPIEINWNSGDHISAILYGGKIPYVMKDPVGLFKTGPRAGQTKYRNVTVYAEFPRLVEPLEGSELAKEGFWSTAEDTLKELNAEGRAKEIIGLLQKQAKINKQRTTYFEGIPKKFEHFGWEDEIMHGQLNQCVARTGRLSSSNPNLQNMDPAVKECIVSRYE